MQQSQSIVIVQYIIFNKDKANILSRIHKVQAKKQRISNDNKVLETKKANDIVLYPKNTGLKENRILSHA